MGGLSPILSRFLRRDAGGEKPRLKLLAWATVAGLIFGVVEFGEPIDDHLRLIRNEIRRQDASGSVVVVAVDDRSVERIRNWPWPREHYAKMAEELSRLGARNAFFHPVFSSRSNRQGDGIFEKTLAHIDLKVGLAGRFEIDPVTNRRSDRVPYPGLARQAEIVNTNFRYDGGGVVWQLPYAMTLSGKAYPSLSAAIAGLSGEPGSMFRIDYSIDPASIPTVSAVDLIGGRVSRDVIAGKDVIVGITSRDYGEVYSFPGYRRIPEVYLHALGGETLKSGRPIDLGWTLPFVFAFLLAVGSVLVRSPRFLIGALVTGIPSLLLAPLALDSHLISVEVVPALFLLSSVCGSLAWSNFRQAYRARATTNALSGLPNFNALRNQTDGTDRPLIAARILNYAEITSSLPPEDEKALVDQIAGRLCVGAANRKLYQGDEGLFAWFEEPAPLGVIGEHLEAVHALFRSPIVVAGTRLDLSVAFGLDAGNDRLQANRLGSALVAAEEAAHEGLKWKEYDPEKLKEASWKLSLLSQLDAAIDAEELWIAYQPKLDLKTGRIVGAEALARWTHAERGPVSPMEFVVAAEQSDRIEKLTSYVLDRAVAAAAAINARGIDFELSVNLSARLIDNAGLAAMVTGILQKHGLAADRLTLEVTETAALNTNGNLEALLELRYSGVQISIDDYGTGLSTLDYLKRIPATEIKIDKSFVQALDRSRSDKLLVHSTIQLAHSLGQKVVAEGIEDRDTLDALCEMGCDVAQGYFIAKPMKFTSLLRYLIGERKRQAA